MSIKQIIVVNNELRSKLRHGKLAAQVSHASMGAVFSKAFGIPCDNGHIDLLAIPLEHELEYWFKEKFTKIVLRADNEEHLLEIHKKAEEAGLLNALITDAGNTVFKEPTITCVGIGPASEKQLKGITDKLKMY